ncbi:MAG: ribbon-helix-helix domain-containing protein [Candidatus Bathyarchaeia archaeon]
MKHNERIAFRLPKECKERIKELIKEGKYRKLSQVIRAALEEFLSKNAG